MSTLLRIGAYLLALAVVFALALGLGTLIGPSGSDAGAGADHRDDPRAGDEDDTGPAAHADHDDHAAQGAGADEASAGGLSASQHGHRLELADDRLEPGRQRLEFTLTDAAGEPVTAYDEVHEKRLHLIVVRRDLSGFQHLHPELDPETGTWSTDVDLEPGAWRVFADARPTGGAALVLGADLLVPGRDDPAELAQDALADSVDGYDVTLGGALTPGREVALTATVTADGEPVDDLEPYLGAHGHLVVLRQGDLAYLHAHPAEDGSSGPEVTFHTEFPSAGRYRAFLDFAHGGEVRTAEFTLTVDDAADDAGHDDDHAEEHEH